MIAALNRTQIEDEARRWMGERRCVILIFSSYNGELEGESVGFLRRLLDYHFQSGQTTDCQCVGYQAFEQGVDPGLGPAIAVPEGLATQFNYFYPRVFHEIRAAVQADLDGQWSYLGGLDVLLFPVGDAEHPVCWDTAAVLQSRKLLGGAYQDSDEMIRDVINMSEALGGRLEAHAMNAAVNRRAFKAGCKKVLDKIGAPLVTAGLGLFR